jgi:hypothetical protein
MQSGLYDRDALIQKVKQAIVRETLSRRFNRG